MWDEPGISRTIRLLRAIGSPLGKKEPIATASESRELYAYSVKNKISLLYLSSLKRRGLLNLLTREYRREMRAYSRILEVACKVSRTLDAGSIQHVIFKTVRPYPALPGDIDVLVLGGGDSYANAIETLLRAGYTPEVTVQRDLRGLQSDETYRHLSKLVSKPTYGWKHVSPTGVSFIDSEHRFPIDLKKAVAASDIVYVSQSITPASSLLPNGMVIKTPSPEMELTIQIIHSTFEQLWPLSEYYALAYALSRNGDEVIVDFLRTLRKNRITRAASAYFSLCALVHRSAFGDIAPELSRVLQAFGCDKLESLSMMKRDYCAPHRYSLITTLAVILEKLREDRFAASAGRQFVHMLNPLFSAQVFRDFTFRRIRDFY